MADRTFISMNVSGLAELEAKLNDLGPKLVRRVLMRALRRACNIWRDEAKMRAPKLTGELSRDIVVKTQIKPSQGSGYGLVGARYTKKGAQDPGVYEMFDEFGTSRQPAQPFLRPAFDAKKDEVLQAFADELGKEIEKAARE